MLSLPPSVRLFMATQPVDGRKGVDSLMVLVRDVLKHDPLSGHLFIFFSRRCDRVRVVYWDRTGLQPVSELASASVGGAPSLHGGPPSEEGMLWSDGRYASPTLASPCPAGVDSSVLPQPPIAQEQAPIMNTTAGEVINEMEKLHDTPYFVIAIRSPSARDVAEVCRYSTPAFSCFAPLHVEARSAALQYDEGY